MKQQLSLLIDGEMALEEASHLITAIKAGGEVKQAWASYHLIGDAMRGEQALSADLSARIMLAIEMEPTVLSPNVNHTGAQVPAAQATVAIASSFVKKPFYQSNKLWSVAASAAAVFFVGFMTLQQYGQEDVLSPVQIAQDLPEEYLAAHQAAAPSNAAYYIQNVSYTEPNR